MATAAEAPALFLRKATGLVKGWNPFDAFIYSFLSVNLVALGLFNLSFAPFVAKGQPLTAALITGVFVTFLVVVYAGLISTMPRAGGDYVWQSRIFGGGPAFVLAVTGWWFILWQWAPIYGNILAVQFFQPIWATLKITKPVDASWFLTHNGIMTVSMITIVLAGIFVSLGMEGYSKVQRFCFYGGIVGLVVMFLLMLFNGQGAFHTAFNREAANLFGTQGDAFSRTIQDSAKFGYKAPGFGFTPLGPSFLLIPFMVFYLLWPNWGASLYGEVRGASDFKRVYNGMFYGLWVTVGFSVVFFLLAAKTFGWGFYMAANSNWANSYYAVQGAPTPAIPVWPYPAMMAGWLVHNQVFQLILILLMSLWFFGWAGTLFLSSTRVIFAAAFDRVLPEWAANVSERRHVPFGALALMLVPSIGVSALYSYSPKFVTYTLAATLVIAVTYLGTVAAGAILPWRRPRLWANSPIARYKVGGVPLITVAGVITAGFLGYNLWKWFTDSTYGLNNKGSYVFMGSLYGLALVIYIVARVVRSRQGVNLAQIHQEIPVE
jgi:amino acid transporter